MQLALQLKAMTSLAVIPARAGSTRLKNKNIYPLGGKPLIRWTVEAVLNSGVFDKVVISTDGEHIFDAVKDLPVERHIRPEDHATVTATALDAMINLMDDYKSGDFDNFAYFLPTCPFVSPEDIRSGFEMLDEKTDFVISMTEMPAPIQLACIMKDDNVVPVFDNLTAGLTNSKFIQKYHKPSGAFYMGKWNKILTHKNFFKGNVKGVLMPKARCVDIDDIDDINFAESVIERERND